MQRSSPAFLSFLVQCGWTTRAKVRGPETGRAWRNQNLADFLRVAYTSDAELARHLCEKLPRLQLGFAEKLLMTTTGVTAYPNFYHEPALQFVKRNSDAIGRAFGRVSRLEHVPEEKAFAVATMIGALGKIKFRKGWLSPFNALTPALACLDPQRRFPIMNSKTAKLLRQIEREPTSEGVRELVRLVGTRRIRDSFTLDAYALFEKFPPPPPRRRRAKDAAQPEYRDLGIKSETDSIAKINAKRTTITKLHNALTNRFQKELLWRQRIRPKEHRFDALIENWKDGRDLLVEAKTASEGPVGRMQVRQAIGQLFDYRFTYFQNKKKLDMAVLLYRRPSEDVRKLLASLQIESLWFEGKRLTGTIRLE
jgi:hypothetical protein